MDSQEKGTAVGGPVGAGAGGYTGRNEANDISNGAGSSATETASPVIRSAQMALNRKGYAAGEADGVLGPSTENAVRQFQEVQRLSITGTLDQDTLSALGISQ
jgi:membrane-bound lytic murein transglycosylase B